MRADEERGPQERVARSCPLRECVSIEHSVGEREVDRSARDRDIVRDVRLDGHDPVLAHRGRHGYDARDHGIRRVRRALTVLVRDQA